MNLRLSLVALTLIAVTALTGCAPTVPPVDASGNIDPAAAFTYPKVPDQYWNLIPPGALGISYQENYPGRGKVTAEARVMATAEDCSFDATVTATPDGEKPVTYRQFKALGGNAAIFSTDDFALYDVTARRGIAPGLESKFLAFANHAPGRYSAWCAVWALPALMTDPADDKGDRDIDKAKVREFVTAATGLRAQQILATLTDPAARSVVTSKVTHVNMPADVAFSSRDRLNITVKDGAGWVRYWSAATPTSDGSPNVVIRIFVSWDSSPIVLPTVGAVYGPADEARDLAAGR